MYISIFLLLQINVKLGKTTTLKVSDVKLTQTADFNPDIFTFLAKRTLNTTFFNNPFVTLKTLF